MACKMCFGTLVLTPTTLRDHSKAQHPSLSVRTSAAWRTDHWNSPPSWSTYTRAAPSRPASATEARVSRRHERPRKGPPLALRALCVGESRNRWPCFAPQTVRETAVPYDHAMLSAPIARVWKYCLTRAPLVACQQETARRTKPEREKFTVRPEHSPALLPDTKRQALP